MRFLNFNKEVTALSSARFDTASSAGRELLLVGTSGSVQVYDPYNNTDAWYRDAPDGAATLAAGPWPTGRGGLGGAGGSGTGTGSNGAANAIFDGALDGNTDGSGTPGGSGGVPTGNCVLIGGNASLTSVGQDGSDRWWTVAGDWVTSLAVMDGRPTAPGSKSVFGAASPLHQALLLAVGSADTELRVFRSRASDSASGAGGGASSNRRSRGGSGGSGSEIDAAVEGETEEVILETNETDGITSLCPVIAPGIAGTSLFAYGLANGTVGVYGTLNPGSSAAALAQAASPPPKGGSGTASGSGGGALQRMWRAKSKGRVVALVAFDFDSDGVPELVCGWSNGKVEVRKAGTGDLLWRDEGSGPLAGLLTADYRGDGRPILLIVTTEGEVRGFPQVSAAALAAYRASAGLPAIGTLMATTAAAAAAAAAAGNAGGGAAPPALPAAAPAPAPASGSGAATVASAAASAFAGLKSLVTGGLTGGAAAAAATNAASRSEASPVPMIDEAALADALAEKKFLESELRRLEAATAAATAAATGTSKPPVLGPGDIPASSDVDVSVDFDALAAPAWNPAAASSATAIGAVASGSTGPVKGLTLTVTSTHHDTVIRSVAAWALDTKLFHGRKECLVAMQPPSLHSGDDPRALRMPLLLDSSTAGCDVKVAATVGSRLLSTHFAVIEKPITLPKYAAFMPLPSASLTGLAAAVAARALVAADHGSSRGRWQQPPIPDNYVVFFLKERAARVAMWLQTAFLLKPDAYLVLAGHHTAATVASSAADPARPGPAHLYTGEVLAAANSPRAGLALDARFLNLKDGSMLRIAIAGDGGGGAQSYGGHTVIQCSDMDLAGSLIQDLCAYLGITQLETGADFPAALESFRETLLRVQDYSAARAKLTGEMAEAAAGVKALVVQAEDARLRVDMPDMKR